MKYVLYLVLSLITLSSCENDDDTPTQLPPATQTGEKTFGCLINGELFKVTNSNDLVAIYQGGLLQLGAEFEIDNIDQGITIWLEREIELKSYNLNEKFLNIGFFRESSSSCQQYGTFGPNSGTISIDNFDTLNFIVSGTFEFQAKSDSCERIINVTNGRFDMKYIP